MADTWAEAMREHEETLKPGVRVEIRLNGECSFHPKVYEPNGSVGVIQDLCYRHSGGDNNGHPYGVNFRPDEGIIYYAAAELIPITDDR